jgi:hypothetical protein
MGMTRYGTELRRVLRARGMRDKDLATALGVSPATVSSWLHGHVPLLPNSVRIADLLDAPQLAAIVRELRTSPCRVCGRMRVHGSNAGRYCGRRCQHADEGRRRREIAGKPGVLAQHRLRVVNEAIDELCRRWCEPEGLCRDATCPIQAAGLSPLPLDRRRMVSIG